jgi:hypothetical protein
MAKTFLDCATTSLTNTNMTEFGKLPGYENTPLRHREAFEGAYSATVV